MNRREFLVAVAALAPALVGCAALPLGIEHSDRRTPPVVKERMKPDPESDGDIVHLDGVAWTEATRPPERHQCWVQTEGWLGMTLWQRCPCGAIRDGLSEGAWMERNSR